MEGMSGLNLPNHVVKIPQASRAHLSIRLVDILLNAKGADKVPSRLAKSFLYLWQKDRLTEDEGLSVLLEAAILLDADSTIKELRELGLAEVADSIQEAGQKGAA